MIIYQAWGACLYKWNYKLHQNEIDWIPQYRNKPNYMLSLSIIKPVTNVKKLCPHFHVYRQSCNSSTESSMRPARWWRKRWCWQQLRTDFHLPAMPCSDPFWNCEWTAAVFFPQIQALPTASVQDFHVHLLHRWFLSKRCRRNSASRRKLSLACRKIGSPCHFRMDNTSFNRFPVSGTRDGPR